MTGGLAAPLVAAQAAALLGSTAVAAALTTSASVYAISSLFAAYGAGLTAWKTKRRFAGTDSFSFVPLTRGPALSATVVVSGWRRAKKDVDDYVWPWNVLASGPLVAATEVFALDWEREALKDLGRALETLVADQLLGMAVSEAIKHTLLVGLAAAMAWPLALASVASVIDNPWSVGLIWRAFVVLVCV